MRWSTSGMLLAAWSIGEAVAGPAHAHLHRRVHEKKDVDWATLDWNAMGVDWSSAWAAGQQTSTTAAPAPAPTTTKVTPVVPTTTAPVAHAATTTEAAAPQSTASSSSGSSILSDVEALWQGLVGVSNELTSFGQPTAPEGTPGDNYKGNVGSPYGSNIIKVNSAEGYDFTNEFVNTQSKAITINIWQKAGQDGQLLSGSALAPKQTTLTFVLLPGGSQVVAFQENTQYAWAEACDSFAASGAYATTWGEANMVSTGSGYDVSAIMNPNGSSYDMTITSAEAPGCTSSMNENYWLTATDPVGGSDGSCFIAQSTATLKTRMGG